MKPASIRSSRIPRAEKRASLLVAVQKIVDDIGVDLDAHVAGTRTLKGRVAQIADSHGGGADQHDLVLERSRRNRTVDYVHHGVLRVGPVGAGVVDESGAIARRVQGVLAELDALQAGFGNVGGDFLVGNLFVFPHRLQSERRERNPGPGNA